MTLIVRILKFHGSNNFSQKCKKRSMQFWYSHLFNKGGGMLIDFVKKSTIYTKFILLVYWFLKFLPTSTFIPASTLWQYRLRSFQTRRTKLERFLPQNQHTQRKLLKFEYWVNGKVSKSVKIWLSEAIFHVKNYPNLSQFFFHWRISI